MPQLSEIELDIQTKLLRATFLKNMAFFQKFLPEIHQLYKSYEPNKVKLTFDSNGEVNIVTDGNLMYSNSPKAESIKQVDAFFKKPQQFAASISRKGTLTYEHERQLKRFYDERVDKVGTKHSASLKATLEQLDFISMIGIGLGHHIQELVYRTKIKHLFIWEPDKGVFFCAMHTLDFQAIHSHCLEQSGDLTIQIGGNDNQFVNKINQLLRSNGAFNMSRLFMYRHYHSEKTDNGFKTLTLLCHRLLSGFGFFEDEIMSISHTLTAAKHKFPLLKAPTLFSNHLSEVPIFIIGNGPSLDQHLDFIKNNQKNAVIFSCGTALKAVLDAGIIPDFHIEMERQAATYEWIDQVGHKEKLKTITIIALNTVYSKIYSLFKNAYIVGKPKDGGMDFLYEFIDKNDYPGAYACNPTVSNAATAFAVRLGFTKLNLFGVDYGFKDETKHHASGSLHNKKDYHGYKKRVASAFSVKGNFCERVLTTQTLDMSRANLELLLEVSPFVKCFNFSDGALIQLTEPTRVEDIKPFPQIDNKEIGLTTLLSDAFSSDIYGNKDFTKLFEEKLIFFKQIIGQLCQSCKGEVKNRNELSLLFSEQYKFVHQFKDKRDYEVYFRFINGTLNYFQTEIMSNTFYFDDEKAQRVYINWSLNLFEQHLNWLLNELIDYYNKPSKY